MNSASSKRHAIYKDTKMAVNPKLPQAMRSEEYLSVTTQQVSRNEFDAFRNEFYAFKYTVYAMFFALIIAIWFKE